ncbi:MAG TPA: hypothetical protein PKV58_00200 [Kaistella sp.]|nr:hypothetical protein [Kaistella sp.]HPZ24339.1 hypothetical protein [Kaistella sp.]
MKKILLILIISGLGLQNTFAQEQKYDWKTMKPDERKAIIQKMSPQERMSLLKQFRQNMVVSELDIPENNQEQFKSLYSEYQEKQNEIKSKFKPNEDYENMSDEEAKQQLNQSFEVGQQLLDNRKAYSQKFMKVIKPQQVLQMYQTEGRMRNKILDRKEDGPQRSQSRRP